MSTDYCLLMTSGFAALVSALIGLGIGPGDEVIVPAYTYIATALAVTNVGAIPVIAEADETLILDV
ncbi:MAG: DegT/DnrJ/EryC1/StrS family aminotransferase [Clostridia bacterium]|nr:DegT/DnrJ/EryC1/StrS family aminotransferase [Clostridia bacterium]